MDPAGLPRFSHSNGRKAVIVHSLSFTLIQLIAPREIFTP
jgi:hypothetical protein